MGRLLWVGRNLYFNMITRGQAISLADREHGYIGLTLDISFKDIPFNSDLLRRLQREGLLNPPNFNDR